MADRRDHQGSPTLLTTLRRRRQIAPPECFEDGNLVRAERAVTKVDTAVLETDLKAAQAEQAENNVWPISTNHSRLVLNALLIAGPRDMQRP